MRLSGLVLAALVAQGVAGCASLSRMAEYGSELADAKTTVEGRSYSLFVHPLEDALLIQRGAGAAVAQSMAQGATLNAVNMMEPKPYWRQAAEWLTAPLGCALVDLYTLDNRMTWEAPYSCPDGVDLRAKVMEQREALRAGAPIRP